MADKAVRRVGVDKIHSDGSFGQYADDPNGDHALVKWEVWKRVVENAVTMASFIIGWWPAYEDAFQWGDDMESDDCPFHVAAEDFRRALREIGEVDGE